jgi:hypothetical protein
MQASHSYCELKRMCLHVTPLPPKDKQNKPAEVSSIVCAASSLTLVQRTPHACLTTPIGANDSDQTALQEHGQCAAVAGPLCALPRHCLLASCLHKSRLPRSLAGKRHLPSHYSSSGNRAAAAPEAELYQTLQGASPHCRTSSTWTPPMWYQIHYVLSAIQRSSFQKRRAAESSSCTHLPRMPYGSFASSL